MCRNILLPRLLTLLDGIWVLELEQEGYATRIVKMLALSPIILSENVKRKLSTEMWVDLPEWRPRLYQRYFIICYFKVGVALRCTKHSFRKHDGQVLV